EPHLRRALELHESLGGAESKDALQTNHLLAVVLRNTNRLDESFERFGAILPAAERVLGEDDERTLQILNDFGQLHKMRGEHPEAIAYFRTALERAERGATIRPAMLAVIRANLGESLTQTRDFDEAREMIAASIEALEQAHPEPHPDTARARLRFAAFLMGIQQPEAARAEYEAAIPVLEQTLDATHPDLLATRAQFGGCLQQLGDHTAAAASFDIAVRGAEATEPPESMRLAWYRRGLGMALLDQGRPEEALPYLEQAVAALRNTRPDLEAKAITELARCLETLGESDRAAALRAELAGPKD
ncbi:MAG: tetratricopeptide repeat protein, partial [Phycisphaerales bacterium JB041]